MIYKIIFLLFLALVFCVCFYDGFKENETASVFIFFLAIVGASGFTLGCGLAAIISYWKN